MRRNIKLEYPATTADETMNPPAIYFYTHWGAENLGQTLQNALKRGSPRWGDHPYLARIIFSEMIQDEILDLVGYGISPDECDPEYATIVVNMEHRLVDGIPFNTFIDMDVKHYRMNEEKS